MKKRRKYSARKPKAGEKHTCRPFIRELSKANIMMHIDRGEKGGRGRCKTGHTGSNNTGVKCATIPFMSCRHRTTSVGVRVVVFEHPASGWLAWAAAGSGFGSKSVLVMRL